MNCGQKSTPSTLPQNSSIVALTPHVIVFGDGAFKEVTKVRLASQMTVVVKNLPAYAGDVRD